MIDMKWQDLEYKYYFFMAGNWMFGIYEEKFCMDMNK